MGDDKNKLLMLRSMVMLAIYCIIVFSVTGLAYYFFVRLQPQETAVIHVSLIASAFATCIAIVTLIYSSYSAKRDRDEQAKTLLGQADEIAKAAANTLYITLETKLVEFIPMAIEQYKYRKDDEVAASMRQVVRLKKVYYSMAALLPTFDPSYLQHIEKIALLYPRATDSVFHLLSHLSNTTARQSINIHSSEELIDALHVGHDLAKELGVEKPEVAAQQELIDINTSTLCLTLEINFARLAILATAICSSLEAFRISEPVSIQRSDVLEAALLGHDQSKERVPSAIFEDRLDQLNRDARNHIQSLEARIIELEAKLPGA